MGLEAVKAAFLQSHRLGDKHAARSLLVWMAFNVRDEASGDKPAMTFWGGFETSAQGLGFTMAELTDPARRAAALTAVKRTQRLLESAGLIEKLSRSAPNRTAVWRLTLDPIEPQSTPAPRSMRGGQRQTGTGVEDRPRKVEDRPVQRSKTDLDAGRSLTPRSARPNPPDRPLPIERAHARARGVA